MPSGGAAGSPTQLARFAVGCIGDNASAPLLGILAKRDDATQHYFRDSLCSFATNPVQLQPGAKTAGFGSGMDVGFSPMQWPTRCAFSGCPQMAQ